MLPKFVGMIVPYTGQPVPATFRVSINASDVYPDMNCLLHLHLHKYHEPMWHDMLTAKSCRGTFWLRGSDHEVYGFQHEVLDMTLDDDDDDDGDDDDDDDTQCSRSTPDIAEANSSRAMLAMPCLLQTSA